MQSSSSPTLETTQASTGHSTAAVVLVLLLISEPIRGCVCVQACDVDVVGLSLFPVQNRVSLQPFAQEIKCDVQVPTRQQQ